jgi:exosome complex component RRP42
MSIAENMSVVEGVKSKYIKELLKQGRRKDGRQALEYRPITIEKGVIPNAEGSALAHLGGTKVLAGVKFDVMTPFKDRPEEGVLMVNAEFCPMAHPTFEPGRPTAAAVELARVVDRGIRSAEVVDLAKFFLEEDKVLGLYVDLWILDNCGNLIDASALAATAALESAKVPKYEDGALLREEFTGPLETARKVIACTFEKVDGTTIVDATDEEENASDGRMTITTCDDNTLCTVQKSGTAGFKKQEFFDLMDIALDKSDELRKKV